MIGKNIKIGLFFVLICKMKILKCIRWIILNYGKNVEKWVFYIFV